MNDVFEAWTGYRLQAPVWLLLLPVFVLAGAIGRGRPALRFAPAAFLERDVDGRRRALPRSFRQRLAFVPTLLQGLSALVKERPPNPVEYLATFLLQNNPDNAK